MIYSLTGVIKEAKNENEANKHINTINQVLWCEQFDLYKDAYSAALIFETEDLDTFLKELQTVVNQFLQQYKERNNYVQNY